MSSSRQRNFRPTIFRFLVVSAILITSLVLAFLSVVWIYGFYPGNRIELPNPQGKPYRAFTQNCGFGDLSILLRASDWPWTFGRPPIIESLVAEPGDPETWVHWSRDGSVLAVRRQDRTSSTPLFSASYDYRNHKLMRQGRGGYSHPNECDRRIVALLEQRGGIGPFETGIDDGKYSESLRSGFPAWGWVVPGCIIVSGLAGCRQALRKIKRLTSRTTEGHSRR
jgi:hypothetical protein